MARTVIQMRYNNFEKLNESIFFLLQYKGYEYICENNEIVWKRGIGFLSAIKYIKIEYAENNTIIVSGWIRPMFGNEQALYGTVGALPKSQVMRVIKEIQTLTQTL